MGTCSLYSLLAIQGIETRNSSSDEIGHKLREIPYISNDDVSNMNNERDVNQNSNSKQTGKTYLSSSRPVAHKTEKNLERTTT